MGGGSRTQTTNSSQTRDPYAPTVPLLGNIISGATDALNSGVGSQVYGGQRVAGLGDTSLAGLDALNAGAAAGSGTATAGNNVLQNLLASSGATTATQAATSGLGSVNPNVDTSGGDYATDSTPLGGLANNLATGGTQTQRSLQDTADGKFLGGSNPYLERVIAQGAGDATSAAAQQFAASGRYGSGRFAGAVADATDRVGTQARYADYDAERARQASAASAIDSAGLARAGTAGSLYSQLANINAGNAGLATTGANLGLSADQAGLTGANALAALAGSNADRSLSQQGALLSAAQGDRQASLAGIASEAANQEALSQQGKTLAQTGSVQDAARQEQLASAQQIFDEQQQSPWKRLALASGVADPIAGLGGTQTGIETRTLPQPSLLSQILGGATGTVGLLSQTGAFGAPTAAAGAAGAGAAGAGAAGGAGWLSSLFTLSDERAKEGMEDVGRTHDGQTIYRYRYKGGLREQLGLSAQEVAQRDPGAVAMRPDGLLTVDYRRATAGAAPPIDFGFGPYSRAAR